MNILFILFYLMAAGMGLISILFCVRLVKMFRLRFLSHYLFFLITFNIAVLYGDVPEILESVFRRSPHIYTLTGILSALLGTPMFLTAVYMFANFISGLFNRRPDKPIRIIYFSFAGMLFLGFTFLISVFFKTGIARPVLIFMGYSMKVYIMLFFSILVYFFVNLKNVQGQNKQRKFLVFGIFQLVIFAVLLCYTIKSCPLASLPQNLGLFLLFILETIPLQILKGLLKQREKEFAFPDSHDSLKALNTFFSRHGISQREAEIIRLLLNGKSNKEIENELFISFHTVRNHIHHIYEKLGIKNRVALVNLVRNSLPRHLPDES